ncbi:ribonucleoside-triphosphate reductase [Eubacterium sulci ATCC 35585]|jgi:anaerobic ribonucleoside-triphosphate reductase|nr:ribonucleoside-triphosphate reductase [Eubacterium sulci ATCC 35585]EUC78226.1 anaerobic ribonucleoside-triphosphate reductase [Eubacterium sulci ATCC 35585]MBF1171583.1 ribonucleoside triphosphate reductase [[Eubacterium] sulci]
MNNVIRRDGTAVAFDPTKIENAVAKAFMATDELDARDISSVSRAICLIVTTTLNGRKLDAATVEEIQDEVESALMNCGYAKTAKAYILYRRQHANVRETKDTLLDYKKLIDGYIGTEKDWRVKENSTVTLSVGGLILSNSGAVTANYWLSEVYDEDVADAHRNCFMHIHDLSMLTGYCAGWSLKQLIQEGLGGVPDRITSAPAKHLTTLCNQMVNFLGIMQNEWAGAQAFSSFDTYLAPFVKVDNLSYKDVKQSIQSFIYGVNTPSRWGTQAPFTNVTLDWTVPEDMINMPALVGGKEMDFTYGDCKAEMDMVNRAFIEIMIEGDANGRGFQYPIPTYSITKDFDWSETENNKLLFEMTAKYGTPYFSNYINSDMNPSDVRSMCCRLRLDLRELRKKGGGFFGSGESTGSIGVVTLNLPRIAYLSSTKEEFYSMLDKYMDIAARSLDTKRKVINRLLEEGLYPYTKRYLGAFNNHFSTIGLVGMNETILNAKWIDSDITKPEGRDFSIEVLNHMRDRLSDYQEMYGDLFNLEATPAESTTYRFAKHDTEEFADIITAACKDQAPYYTNSTHLPVNYTEDIFDALEMEDEMQTLYTSGTVFHGFLGERMPDWKAAANLVKKIAYNFKLPYYTLSPTYSICESHGYIAGEHFSCPHCGKATEVYSRITGYYRPVRNWNDGKSSEFENRKTYEPEELFSVNRNLLEEAGVEMPRVGTQTLGRANRVEAPKSNSDAEKVILVTTKTCPNCQAAKNYLNQAGIEYDVILADEADGAEIAVQYNISAAPTLIVQSGEEAELYSNVSNIRAYIGKRS